MTNIQTFKQRLYRIHASLGITLSLLMYISIFFGVFTIFLPYIQNWEKPSRHIQSIDITKVDYNIMIDKALSDPDFPKNNILITLPGTKNDPTLKISQRFIKPIYFNPITKEKIQDEDKSTHLARFLNEMHYGKTLDMDTFGNVSKFFGRTLFGLLAVGVMIISISGLMLVIYMKFKNKGHSQKSFFSKYHIKIFTWAFPIVFIITLSGAFMNIGLLSSSPLAKMVSGGKSKTIDSLVGPVLFPRGKPIKKEGTQVQMLEVNKLLKKAQKINPNVTFQEARLINWYDKSAQIEFRGYNPYMPFLNGGFFNKPKVVLSAYDGTLIKSQKVLDRDWGVFAAEATYYLHFLFGLGIFPRAIIALIMFACGIAVFFGVMLWLGKESRKFDKKIPFYHWMDRLSLSIFIGVIPATGLLFALHWILPLETKDRIFWQEGIFFDTWLFTLFWSFFRINRFQIAKEFLALGGVFFMIAPILHYFVLKITPLYLINNKIKNILGVDIALFIFGLVLIYCAKKLPKNDDEFKLIWKRKKEKSHEQIK